MSKGVIALLGVLGAIALVLFLYISVALSYRNACVHAEAGIVKQYERNQSNYDAMWKTFVEMTQVGDMQVEDLKEIYDAAMRGRYGENGSQAIFQWLQEAQINYSPETRTQIQRSIEANRAKFDANQASLLSKKEAYTIVLNDNRAMFVSMWFSFPQIDLDDYGIVTSAETDAAFQSGHAGPINMRPNKP